MPRIKLPIIVEGRYDKSAILGIFSATVITTDGFGIFNSREKQALIKKIGKDGIILLTDSDGGGRQIRSFVSGLIPKEKIYQVYIPRIEGKEKRKTHAGKEGVLGVEGVGGDVLRRLLMPFSADTCEIKRGSITKTDLFNLGLTGKDNSAALRDSVALALDLPTGMSAKAFHEALNIVTDKDELLEILNKMT